MGLLPRGERGGRGREEGPYFLPPPRRGGEGEVGGEKGGGGGGGPGQRGGGGGGANLPNPEVISTVVRITLNAFPTEINENRNQLVVRKVGLPPLLVSPADEFSHSLYREVVLTS